jgi:hypothetical protein
MSFMKPSHENMARYNMIKPSLSHCIPPSEPPLSLSLPALQKKTFS